MKKSKGVYRIPYKNGTKVKVTNDHLKHDPIGRIDMSGKGDFKPYEIVAAADGVIKFIEDSFSKQLDCSDGVAPENNYVWIAHANGEWTKYSHMKKNSTTKTAKLKVGDSVKAGDFLGFEDKVGCASGSHLHFEVGVPKASDPIKTTGGYLKDNTGSKRNRIPRICGIPGGVFVAGETYVAEKVPGNLKPGFAEIARHGLPEKDYQCFFDQAVDAGYELAWINAFNHKGKIFFNVVLRPQGKSKWAAFHGLDAKAYQKTFTDFTKKGFRPVQVESYERNGSARYAIILKKASGPNFKAYHGFSATKHQDEFDKLTMKGWAPKNISVISVSGNRQYTALYEKANVGKFVARSTMTPGEYQDEFDKNTKGGLQVAYLNAYNHQGDPFLTAIWNSKTNGAFKARHNLTGSQYQKEYDKAISSKLLTRYVTGYSGSKSSLYAAVWRK